MALGGNPPGIRWLKAISWLAPACFLHLARRLLNQTCKCFKHEHLISAHFLQMYQKEWHCISNTGGGWDERCRKCTLNSVLLDKKVALSTHFHGPTDSTQEFWSLVSSQIQPLLRKKLSTLSSFSGFNHYHYCARFNDKGETSPFNLSASQSYFICTVLSLTCWQVSGIT